MDKIRSNMIEQSFKPVKTNPSRIFGCSRGTVGRSGRSGSVLGYTIEWFDIFYVFDE